MSLFDHLGPSQTDCTSEQNTANARLDLDRALDRHDAAALATWARLYGPSLCEAALDGPAATDAAHEAEKTVETLNERIAGVREEFGQLVDELEPLRCGATEKAFTGIDRLVKSISDDLSDDNQPDQKAKAA